MARIGFLGTGLMGAPMAMRLIGAGHDVHVWNRSVEKAEPLRLAGAVVEATPQAVAAGTEMIAMCLTDAAAVEDVLFGDNGVCREEKTSVVDFTSMNPFQSLKIAERMQRVGAQAYVDAPVSGGVSGAENGTLVVMCGGVPDQIARFEPVFKAVASRVTHMGGVGAGQVAKLCNQHIVASTIIAMAEAVALARRIGIDVRRLPDALEGGLADSKTFRLWGVRMAMGSWEPNVGALDTMWKDVRNVLATMQSSNMDAPLAHAVEAIYAKLSLSGRGRDDLGSIVSFFDSIPADSSMA
jgi:3-hydroxyisobutyrate dehydrogenase